MQYYLLRNDGVAFSDPIFVRRLKRSPKICATRSLVICKPQYGNDI